jgi:hypothetical protein
MGAMNLYSKRTLVNFRIMVNWIKMRIGEVRWVEWTTNLQLSAVCIAVSLIAVVTDPIAVCKIIWRAVRA